MAQKLSLIIISALIHTMYISYFDNKISNSDIYMYGTVTTHNDQQYKGQIRWGKEEIFWFDMFNSSKPDNPHLQHLSQDERANLNKTKKWHQGKIDVPFVKKWNWAADNGHTHTFAMRFGDIQKIEVKRNEWVSVYTKSGEKISLRGGANDIGTHVQIDDPELGNIIIDWDQIAEVSFHSGSNNTPNKYGVPLYGTVTTRHGSFVGYVQWDHDERMSKDELNGDHEDGRFDILFESIASIKRVSGGAEVRLASGRSFKLSGTNDVNHDNRGIIVNIKSLGRVDIPWDEFNEVVFEEAPKNTPVSYDSFQKGGQKITGTVTTSESTYSGQLIYDLDETYLGEMLNGKKDNIEYSIPFEWIQSVVPKDVDSADVTLTSGTTLHLEDIVDVNSDNDGVLVEELDHHHQYIPWDEILSITIE